MIEILSHNSPMLSLRIQHEGHDVRVNVVMVREITDLLIGSLEGSINRYGIAEGIETWAWVNNLTVINFVEHKPVGVSLHDIATAYGVDEDDVPEWVKSFVDSKKITAATIGKCAMDARKGLYRLSEILQDLGNFRPLTPSKKQDMLLMLAAKERQPKQ